MLEVLLDTLIDSIKLLPFLFITYVLMEMLEHKTSSKTKGLIRKSGKVGPLIGGILGVVPQCGFSAAASNLYAGRVITLGTLIAIFLSTSDEMLPIFLSEQVEAGTILSILAMKLVIGVIAGFIIDFIIRSRRKTDKIELQIGSICEHDHCHCDKSIWKSALNHTVKIMVYIILISLALNLIIFFIGEENLAGIILNQPVIGSMIAGIVGLIPNCAASVIITQLYVEGILSVGAMLAGLLAGAGVGVLVLFKVNYNIKENIKIVALLYSIGVICGIIIDMLGIVL